jgi:hypothetical protein
MGRKSHFERDDRNEENTSHNPFRFSRRKSPESYVIQGMYKSEEDMIRGLKRMSSRLNLTWLTHAVSGFLGRRKPIPVLQARMNVIRVVKIAPMHNGGAKEITGICGFCDFWDKAYGGCLIKRMNGDGFTCPYTNGHMNFSFHKDKTVV